MVLSSSRWQQVGRLPGAGGSLQRVRPYVGDRNTGLLAPADWLRGPPTGDMGPKQAAPLAQLCWRCARLRSGDHSR